MTHAPQDNLQTFTGRSPREVYAKVRAELGPQAVIVEQTSANGLVRVVASPDFPELPGNPQQGRDVFSSRLAALGFEPTFIEALPRSLRSWQEVQQAVLAALPLDDLSGHLQGVLRVVGAPGAGKTTTVIKLMAEHVLRAGPSSCALVSTDQRRLAGCEQLALAAELLGVHFVETNPAALAGVLAGLGQRELVLVDTAGISFGQPLDESRLCADVLVMPATWQASALRRLWRQLDGQRVASVVLSHADQCETLGPVLSVLTECRRPLRWLSRGPDLYDDLEPASRNLIAEMLFPEIDRSEMSTTFA